eukprot:TRINITY_DN8970_c0_g1_i1.p1 TRINITY_DN8970_c0_g1~~TRINITY_DN8970_c0_g1_i1.p1  ORF type:complete len:246 (-),score=57.25 TRINITY_DN8970_c0_g1_i1:173-910(-)
MGHRTLRVKLGIRIDLHKIGGLAPLINMMLNHPSEVLRRNAGKVFANAVQNNIVVQKWALENSALALISQYDKETSISLKEQVLSSISSNPLFHTVAFARSISPGIRLEFLKAKGLELVFSILSCPETNSKLNEKGIAILNDFLCNEKDMFPSSPQIVSQQIEKKGLIGIMMDKLLKEKASSFFLQDKTYLLLEYLKNNYKKELVEAEGGKIKEFIGKLEDELKTNEGFHDAITEEIAKFSNLLT